MDCDGQVNITDPLIILNWLFSDGPEPCAIAQTDAGYTEMREEVTALRATVDALAARVPGAGDIVTLRRRFLVTPGTPTIILDVPEDKSFVVTTASFPIVNLTLVSVLDGNSTPITLGVEQQDHMSFEWSSGFALPRGADVGLDGIAEDPGAEVYLNGYLVGP